MGMMIDARLNGCLESRLLALVLAAPLLAVGAHCGGNENVGSAKAPVGSHSENVTHESCGESGGRVEALDTNGDGKPDIRTFFDGSGRQSCRIVDLNHDGKPDLYEYFDDSGTVRRREYCYDDTGTVNAIETYEGGKLARREYDINGQHRIDTWDFFDTSAPVDPKTGRPAHPIRRERDTTGDGQVDQWWTWNGDALSIAFDRTGNGTPDPESTIVMGENADAGAPPAPAPATASGGDSGAPAPATAPTAPAAPDGGKP